MDDPEGNEFGKQFAGSAAANVVFVVGMLLYKFIEGRCKHSRCSSNTSWLSCNVDNYETERSTRNRVKDAVQPPESVPEMQAREHKIIQEKHITIDKLELRDPESLEGNTREPSVVKGDENV